MSDTGLVVDSTRMPSSPPRPSYSAAPPDDYGWHPPSEFPSTTRRFPVGGILLPEALGRIQAAETVAESRSPALEAAQAMQTRPGVEGLLHGFGAGGASLSSSEPPRSQPPPRRPGHTRRPSGGA